MNKRNTPPTKKYSQLNPKENKFYDDFPVQEHHGFLSKKYLRNIRTTIYNALEEHPKTFAFRLDLHLPELKRSEDYLNNDIPSVYNIDYSKLISKFIDSVKVRIKFDLKRRSKESKRNTPCTPRFIWCRERDKSIHDHYHLLILLNKDAYHRIRPNNSLGLIIKGAWASALGCEEIEDAERLVHIPNNAGYWVVSNHPEYKDQLNTIFHRTSYLAKIKTKHYHCAQRNFGCSQK